MGSIQQSFDGDIKTYNITHEDKKIDTQTITPQIKKVNMICITLATRNCIYIIVCIYLINNLWSINLQNCRYLTIGTYNSQLEE